MNYKGNVVNNKGFVEGNKSVVIREQKGLNDYFYVDITRATWSNHSLL